MPSSPGTVALDPRLNVRLFPAGLPRSAAAAQLWCGAAPPAGPGAWNLLIDGLAPPEARALAGVGLAVSAGQGPRSWLAGSASDLLSLADRAGPPLGPEISAALRAVRASLESSPRVVVMGVLNVTPDSFSDGGRWLQPEAAVERGLEMAEQGADVIDVGGESTRPGAAEVEPEEELRRVLPVVRGLRARCSVPISIDTRNSAVARACLESGAGWVNDVSGMTHDPAMAGVAAAFPGTSLVLMHSRARPSDERYSVAYPEGEAPRYADVVADTLRWLRRRARAALEAGIAAERLWIDPGFGFGKSYEQNLELLRRLREYTSAGLPVLIGTSRKSSVGRMVGDLPPAERLEGTAATVAWAAAQGAAAVRVHDVREMVRVVRAVECLR